MQDVEFKFSQPGCTNTKPSRAMADALRQFVQSQEVRGLIERSHQRGRKVVVQVFHSAEGHPILIHVTAVAPEAKVEC